MKPFLNILMNMIKISNTRRQGYVSPEVSTLPPLSRYLPVTVAQIPTFSIRPSHHQHGSVEDSFPRKVS